MSRPDFPKPYTPLPANVIRRIREEQRAYDRDPEGYERRERMMEEQRQLEIEQERLYWLEVEEKQQEELQWMELMEKED